MKETAVSAHLERMNSLASVRYSSVMFGSGRSEKNKHQDVSGCCSGESGTGGIQKIWPRDQVLLDESVVQIRLCDFGGLRFFISQQLPNGSLSTVYIQLFTSGNPPKLPDKIQTGYRIPSD